eukprot:scaffold11532_cov119-Cylindrotheca_fusiformis.AAC.2
MPRRSGFKKSSSFRDLLERREAAGLGPLEPELLLGATDDHPQGGVAIASEKSDESNDVSGSVTLSDDAIDDVVEPFSICVDRELPMLRDFNHDQAIDGNIDRHMAAFPACGDRELPMFRDFSHLERNKDSNHLNLMYVHDQLPSAEELKLSSRGRSGRDWVVKRRFTTWTLIAGGLITISLVLLYIFLLGTEGVIHNLLDNNDDRIEEVIQLLIESGASPEISLRVTENAQHEAAVYIAAGDAYSATWADDPKMTQRLVERFTLATIYYGMNGKNWNYRLRFLDPIDHCSWSTDFKTDAGNLIRLGVHCNENGLITELNLGYNNLGGFEEDTLPMEVQNLKEMELLHLHNNAIAGPFPIALTKIPRLKSVTLQYNKLVGQLPDDIGTMTQLTSLGLGSNQLSGEIPHTIAHLSNLRLLGLGKNHLQGDLKSLFGGLRQLEFLYLEQNWIGGSLDDDLVAEWAELVELDLSSNLVFGKLSREVLNMPKLRILDLNRNQIGGSFPDDTLENTVLEYLDLQNNHMKGTVSDRLAFLSDLKHLGKLVSKLFIGGCLNSCFADYLDFPFGADISGNFFTGTLPDTVSMMTSLEHLATVGNSFQDQHLLDLRKLTNLRQLSMKDNNLIGSIPDWITEMTKLEFIDLDTNRLRGSIPDRIGFIDDLKFLILSRNELTGTLPGSMALMARLDLLLIDGNSIKGNAENVCETTAVQPSKFIADCYPEEDGRPAEIQCICCTSCCLDNDPRCNDQTSTSMYDPSWQYGYIRPRYMFNIENAPAKYAESQRADESIMDQIP